jgi:hypothetical protein
MSVCEFCGESAGWFQSRHPACVSNAADASEAVQKLVFDGAVAGRSYDELSGEVEKVLADRNVRLRYVRDSIFQGANDAASQVALKSPVSTSDFNRLVNIIRGFDGSLDAQLSSEYTAQMIQRQWFAMGQLPMSYVLWQVLNNITPNFDETGETVAFNLLPGELPIYQTGDCVTYSEERTITSHSRSYQGLSLPVGGGIYYHIGGSQGHQERTSGLLPLDGGRILITNHSLYFGGQKTTLRIPLAHVLRYQSYVDGVGVCESHGAPKIFVFNYRGMDAGWFFYNLLSALSSPRVALKALEPSAQQGNQFIINLQSAFDTFNAADDRFGDLMRGAVTGEGTITTDDLETYAATVEGLFAAAKELGAHFQFVSTAASKKYHEALQTVETSWATFVSVKDGHMSGDAYIPFLNDIAAFMKTRNEIVLGL